MNRQEKFSLTSKNGLLPQAQRLYKLKQNIKAPEKPSLSSSLAVVLGALALLKNDLKTGRRTGNNTPGLE